MIRKDDTRSHKRRKSGCDSVAGALANRDGMKEGDNEPTYPRLLERTLFALRGFSSVGSSDIVNRVVSYHHWTPSVRGEGKGLALRKVLGLFHT